MPSPIPLPIRQQIIRLRKRGKTIPQIAQAINRPIRSVARLLARHRREPESIPVPHYDRRPHHRHSLPQLVQEQFFALAEHHPSWGAPYLRTVLRQQHAQLHWPSVRTLQRWLEKRRPRPVPTVRRHSEYVRAEQAHAVWQMDATDQLPLRTGRQISWLRIVDECTGAFLQTRVFPPGPLQSGSTAVGSGRVAKGF